MENLVFSTSLAGGGGIRAIDALEQLGVRRLAGLAVHVLSAGQRRRVALARLLTSERPIWLLDEPLAALDSAGQSLVAEILEQHLKRGGSALVATHQPLGLSGRTLDLGSVR